MYAQVTQLPENRVLGIRDIVGGRVIVGMVADCHGFSAVWQCPEMYKKGTNKRTPRYRGALYPDCDALLRTAVSWLVLVGHGAGTYPHHGTL